MVLEPVVRKRLATMRRPSDSVCHASDGISELLSSGFSWNSEREAISVGKARARSRTSKLVYCTGEDAMAKLITFYVPTQFTHRVKWLPPARRGVVITFPSRLRKKSA